jgi:putative tryptophan/tyrosine transport system substrate-binding protein
VPGAAVIGALIDPRTNEGAMERRDLEAAAQAVGQQLVILEVTTDREVESSFASLVDRRAGALLIGVGPFLTGRHPQLRRWRCVTSCRQVGVCGASRRPVV